MSAQRRGWVRKALIIAVSVAIATASLVILPAASSQALSGSQFSPGNIITDTQFYNGSAMSEAQIEAFLNSKIGTCESTQCLNVLTTSVASRPIQYSPAGAVRCQAFTGGNLAAAEIIYRAQVACGISAEVLLVTLQKEQGLVGSRNPSSAALSRAMGYACPDSGTCATTTLGFGNQVYSAALQFITYKVDSFGRQTGRYAIQYSPNAACGSSVVDVQNFATAALYNYTPYQPDAAALANLTGTGDACSSYGNRNFWYYFNSWFGSGAPPPPVAITDASLGEPSAYILAADGSGNFWLYPGNGTGGFAGARGQVGSGWDAMTAIFSVGDFNGDGKSDIFARDNSGALWMYSRDGSGGWLPKTEIGTGGWGAFTALTGAGDFNGDGHVDVLARDSTGDLWLYPGNGSGGWLPRVLAGSGWNGYADITGVGDFNGDGHADVVARDAAGTLWLYPGNGKGGFLPRVQIATGWGGFSSFSGAGDFNGDGHPDILATDAAGALWLYPGNGTGGLLAPVEIGTGGWGAFPAMFAVETPPPPVTTPPPAASAGTKLTDFNGDGHSDVLARDAAGALWLYPGNGTGGFLPRIKMTSTWGASNSLTRVGDFNGDGFPDAVSRDTSGNLWLYPGNGTGGFGPKVKIGSGWGTYSAIVGIGDFNGDGHADILARDSAGALWLYPGNGTGGFLPRVSVGSGGWNAFSVFVGGIDFNGDGHTDLLVRDAAGALWLYPGNGKGGWLPRVEIGTGGWNAFTSITGGGDYNGDGTQDLLARDSTGALWMYPGNGKGGWLPRVQVGSGWNPYVMN